MFDLNPDTVSFIIDKARQFHVKEAVTIPEDAMSVTEDWAAQMLADHAYDPAQSELTNTIQDLEPDQQVTLVALMWLGRGDYTLDEWKLALSDAGERWNTRTATYLIATPLLADYLLEGLVQHGYDSV